MVKTCGYNFRSVDQHLKHLKSSDTRSSLVSILCVEDEMLECQGASDQMEMSGRGTLSGRGRDTAAVYLNSILYTFSIYLIRYQEIQNFNISHLSYLDLKLSLLFSL